MKNPFVLTGYRGGDYFCDRKKELEWLEDQYSNDRNVVLHSWRRMGKTSLIFHFFHKLQRKKVSCIFVDLMGTTSMEDSIKKIAEAVIHKYGKIDKGLSSTITRLLSSIGASLVFDPLSGIPQLDLNYSGASKPDHSLEAIGRFLSSQDTPVIIAIDEFQQIVNYEDKKAEAIFRGWAQQFPKIRIFFSGSHRHMMMSMFSEANRPFYRSAQLFGLEPIPENEYSKFIIRKFKNADKKINDIQIRKIFEWTRNQTYYIQLACNKLYGKTDDVKDIDLQMVFNEMIQQEIPIFSSYQQLLTSLQWKVFMAIAKENGVENPLSQAFLRKYNLGAASSVKSAIDILTRKELVIYWDNKYQLHDTLLLRWLQQL